MLSSRFHILSNLSRIAPWALCCAAVLALSDLASVQADEVVVDTGIGRDLAQIELFEGDILQWSANGRRSLAQLGTSPTWQDGIVPYRIAADLPAYSVNAISEAIESWNRVSGISLLPVEEVLASDPSLSAANLDSVLFQPGEGCASWVGRRGGEQEIWVAPSCNKGSMMHEIGHVLGLEHEHTRPDRDQYIEVHWENITPEKRHNFDIASSRAVPIGDYDYGSIMHYGPRNFAIGNASTITPINSSRITIGQRSAPSEGDLAAVAQLYGTDLSVVTQIYGLSDGFEATILVSNNLAQGAHDIEVDVSQDYAQLLALSDNGWRCLAQESGEVRCHLNRLAATSSSVLILRFASDVDTAVVRAEVRSKTPDPSDANNSDTSDVPTTLAAVQLQDDVQVVTVQGAIHPLWILVGLLLLQRKSGLRVDR